jgi:hypothetical protein
LRGTTIRPAAARGAGGGLKLHRRVLRLDGREHTVLTLRPGTRARFATNNFHDAWHLLSDQHGARVLAQLLWGLSHQRKPGTLVLIDRPSLDPNPFDAEPADPIVLVPATLTPLSSATARALRRRLPLRTPSDGTVRWPSSGLAPALAARRERVAAVVNHNHDRTPGRWQPEARPGTVRVQRIGGLVAAIAPPAQLRRWAVFTGELGDHWDHGMDYTELDGGGERAWLRGEEGEVQIFRDYHRMVRSARIARDEVRALAPDLPPAELNPLIWARAELVRRRRSGNCAEIGA